MSECKDLMMASRAATAAQGCGREGGGRSSSVVRLNIMTNSRFVNLDYLLSHTPPMFASAVFPSLFLLPSLSAIIPLIQLPATRDLLTNMLAGHRGLH